MSQAEDIPGPSFSAPGLDRTQRQLRAPWAAGIAGLAFAVLFTLGLILLRSQPLPGMSAAEIEAWFASGDDLAALIGGLYLAPFAGIAFLWFVAVIRDQIGDREDKFFGTVFFGSGLLFVGLLFVTSGVAASIEVGVRYLDQAPPSETTVDTVRAISYTLLFTFATRAAALFVLSTATVGSQSRMFPRWFTFAGYAIGIALLVAVTFYDWSVLLLPLWVAITSLFILRRERARNRAQRAAEAAG